MKNRITIFLLILFIFGTLFYFLPRDSVLRVFFLDVGQGDAIYIRTPSGFDVLIDGGSDKKVIYELGRVMPFWDREIDMMILTHPDADHITGQIEVMRRFDIGKILYTGISHTTAEYELWAQQAQAQDVLFASDGDVFELGDGVFLDVLFAGDHGFAGVNNTGIVARLRYDNFTVLLTADIEAEVEEYLLTKNVDLSSTVLKVGHHGSSTSSTAPFLDAVHPSFAVISVGKDNRFGHPSLLVLHELQKRGIMVYRTDFHSCLELRIFSDGLFDFFCETC